MTEKPILFTPAMVAAILRDENPKTQTRRVLRRQPDEDGLAKVIDGPWTDTDGRIYKCPYDADILWVKETHWRWGIWKCENGRWHFVGCDSYGEFLARPVMFKKPNDYLIAKSRTESDLCYHKRPSIFMPRKFARIFLRVKDVSVGRVQDITPEDARAEGAEETNHVSTPNGAGRAWCGDIIAGFRNLWNSINGKKPGCSFADNPWCWVVSFERIGSEAA